MTVQDIIAAATQQKCVGLRYQKSGRNAFRDRVTVYTDGKLLFERFCYGEAAGLVFEMTGLGADEQGRLQWNYDACPNSHKTEAPTQLSGGTPQGVLFDGKAAVWECTDALKTDPAHGYTFWSKLGKRLLRK